MKKFLSVLLVVVMAAAMFAVPTSAAEKVIPLVNTAPTVDGTKDAAYANGLEIKFDTVVTDYGTVKAKPASGLEIKAYALHDNTNLYMFIEITDATAKKGDTAAAYKNDAFRIIWYNAVNDAPTTGNYFQRDSADNNNSNVKITSVCKEVGTAGNWVVEYSQPLDRDPSATGEASNANAFDLVNSTTGKVQFNLFYFDCDPNAAAGSEPCTVVLSMGATKMNPLRANAEYDPKTEAPVFTLGTTAVDAQQGGNTNTGNTGNTGNTNTGDNTVAFVGLALVSAIALAGVQLSKKRV